jgi:hypothetical protein
VRAVGGALAPAKLQEARAGEDKGGSGAGGLGDGARLLYKAEGQAGGRIGGGRRARRRPPLRLGGDLGARPLREGEEGAGRCWVSARCTKGEGEEARGSEGCRGGGGPARPGRRIGAAEGGRKA